MMILQPRVALYAVISAIEEDLRSVLARGLGVSAAPGIFGDELTARAQDRAHRDLGDRPTTVGELLPYVDFGDAWQLVARQGAPLPPVWSSTAKQLAPRLEKLVATRNRVMHTRPLNFEDLPLTLETAQRLDEVASLEVPRLRETLRLLADDPAALDRVLPEPDNEEQHNLPYPDFDETGFIGRRDTIEHVKTLCLGPFPVITILGEGGMGKTAAAVKVAYELLDDPRSPFEATIWCSSKTTQLTAGDVVSIEGAITSSLGLIAAVASELVERHENDPTAEVLSYMAEFRILLILDNLETVLDERIRTFLTKLPMGSKVLITSRIGLGTLEHPVRLPKLADDEAVELIRSLARVRGVDDLVRMDNRRLTKHCRKMDNNPLWIKWFVSGVQAGSRPEDLLSNPSQFLEFSMSNVYGYLSERSREVLQAMQGAPGKRSQSELVVLSGLTVEQLQAALAELCVTNMVTMISSPVGSTFETHYALGELPRSYLSKHHPVAAEVQRRIGRRQVSS
jgi:hypothetical protein